MIQCVVEIKNIHALQTCLSQFFTQRGVKGIDFVNKLVDAVRVGTIVVQEIEKVVPYSPDTTKWEILRDKTYGRARFLILRRRGNK